MNRVLNFAVATAAATAITASAISARADRTTYQEAPAGSTMWFADKHATAYYQIDKGNAELIATILPGPAGGNVIEVRRKLRFNDSEAITVRGRGPNPVAATLIVKHSGADILSRVRTENAVAAAGTN